MKNGTEVRTANDNRFGDSSTQDEVLEAAAPSVMEAVVQHHTFQKILCDRLEKIADSLPLSFDPQEALIVARQIMPTILSAHRFEETVLFGLIPAASDAQDSLERLRYEHWEDEASGEDLVDALSSYVKAPDPDMAGKLSYMLRGFFDNLRRHIAFEEETILPIVRKTALA